MDTRPISAVLAIAAYQLPVARGYGTPGDATPPPPPFPRDVVEISPEARRKAEGAASDLRLWGEVRYDPPHNDDPDLPWEVEHKQWVEMVAKVLGGEKEKERRSA